MTFDSLRLTFFPVEVNFVIQTSENLNDSSLWLRSRAILDTKTMNFVEPEQKS